MDKIKYADVYMKSDANMVEEIDKLCQRYPYIPYLVSGMTVPDTVAEICDYPIFRTDYMIDKFRRAFEGGNRPKYLSITSKQYAQTLGYQPPNTVQMVVVGRPLNATPGLMSFITAQEADREMERDVWSMPKQTSFDFDAIEEDDDKAFMVCINGVMIKVDTEERKITLEY